MKHLYKLLAAASAAFFVASAQAQNAGTVTNHAVVIGRGAGVQGYGSLAGTVGNSSLPLISQGASLDPIYAQLSNAGLVNSSITIGTTTISLGASSTSLAGLTLTTYSNTAAPSTPAVGNVAIWTDPTDKRLHDKNDAGTIGTTVVSSTAPANQWANGLSSAGAIQYAQINFSNLAGSLACSQRPALTGDVTASAGSCATTIAASAVTYAKMQNVAASRLLGNPTGSPAAPSEISLGATLTFSGTALQTAAHTGDVTTAANSFATTIAANAVTNAKMATMAANTIKANATGSSATPTDVDISTLTAKASPSATDLILISDQAASGALKKATVSSLASAGSVASLNGQTGAIVSYFAPQGRLTLATGAPVMATTQSAKTTIFYTPYVGNMIPIYDGTNMVPTAFSEISVATTDTLKNPSSVGTVSVYDYFVWNDSGTLRLSHGPAWTNDTTRSAGTALVMVNGIWLNNVSITNACAAQRCTYVGTVRSDGSSQLNWVLGANGTAANLAVWNAYNRVLTKTVVSDSTATWTYASATIRQSHASSVNQVSFVSGLQTDSLDVNCHQDFNLTSGTNAFADIGVALDSITAFDKNTEPQRNTATGTMTISASLTNGYPPQLGYHFIAQLEASDGTNTATYIGGSKHALGVAGMF